MNKYLVSYATPEYKKSQDRLHRSALKFGIDRIIPYNRERIKNTSFYAQNKKLLSYRRGAGYYAWKPYIILDAMKTLHEGDLLIYSDSGIAIIKELSPLIELSLQNQGILLFAVPDLLNRSWTKHDCFVLTHCDSRIYHDADQVMSGFTLFIKSDKSLNFIDEWLYYCQQIHIISDLPNVCGLENFPDFQAHRHDQSILSLLAVKHGLNIFRDPSQWGNHKKMEAFREDGEFLSVPHYSDNPYLNSPYGTIIDVHREHSHNFYSRIKGLFRERLAINLPI